MDKTAHTPGPWVACGLDSRSPYVCADAGKKWDNPEICNLFNDVTPVDSVSGQWLEPLPNAAANARLIAQAPELLASLRRVLRMLEIHDARLANFGEVEEARLIISRAEGAPYWGE